MYVCMYVCMYVNIVEFGTWCVTSCVAVNKKSWPGSLHLPRYFVAQRLARFEIFVKVTRLLNSSDFLKPRTGLDFRGFQGYSKLFYWDEVLVFAWWCSAERLPFGNRRTGNGKSAQFLRQVETTQNIPHSQRISHCIWSPKGILAGWWFRTFGSFFHILGIIIPTDYIIFVRGVGQPPTSSLIVL